ncbi:UDP-glucose 4-epimerase 2 [Chytriomyces hyalinus]|nr:UDP-glucose 4-epimerase 2 [Chytriomyces hyalinus]
MFDELNKPPVQPDPAPCIFVTGGAGYIGSNTVLEILLKKRESNNSDWEVVVVDNLRNSNTASLVITQKLAQQKILAFHKVDLLDLTAVETIFRLHPNVWAVIHFASLKSVAESCANPLLYYDINLKSALNVLSCANERISSNRNNRDFMFIFSSSACVYGDSLDHLEYDFRKGQQMMGATEECLTKPKSPYGKTKQFTEDMIRDICKQYASLEIAPDGADNDGGGMMKAAILRYFNPVGAHSSGHLGEYNNQEPENLVPVVTRLARRLRDAPPEFDEALKIFGSDWPTPDGSAIRDYLHISDLAKSHVCALERLKTLKHPCQSNTTQGNPWNCLTFNIGCGEGKSVKEVVAMIEKVSGIKIPTVMSERRAGDIGIAISNPAKAFQELNWKTEKSFEDMCRDAWKFELSCTYQQTAPSKVANDTTEKADAVGAYLKGRSDIVDGTDFTVAAAAELH